MSKIQFRELFTTFKGAFRGVRGLCEICQRYNFESYSQRDDGEEYDVECCVRYVKDTISRAIHNSSTAWVSVLWLCEICQRYNFESYSQHPVGIHPALLELCEICQRYNFESYSQRVSDTVGAKHVV